MAELALFRTLRKTIFVAQLAFRTLAVIRWTLYFAAWAHGPVRR